VGSRQEVYDIVEKARTAGATVVWEPDEVFWGGYTALIFDPDGHPWEIAHNPGWHLDEDGGIHLSD
jgi:uncharacterized glyoxalase superfamily protein PhnB